jgi:hypothetical protein
MYFLKIYIDFYLYDISTMVRVEGSIIIIKNTIAKWKNSHYLCAMLILDVSLFYLHESFDPLTHFFTNYMVFPLSSNTF